MREHTLFRRTTLPLLFLTGALAAQTQKLESCKPVSERTNPEGCWILASKPLGKLPAKDLFWTLDVFPDRRSAEAASGTGGTVLDALGRVWLLTVGSKPDQPSKGQRVTQIRPLPVKADEEYTAQYRESIMTPGAVSRTHLHAGPEIFYTETGETCLETPSGKQLSRPGHDVMVPEMGVHGADGHRHRSPPRPRSGAALLLEAAHNPRHGLARDRPLQPGETTTSP